MATLTISHYIYLTRDERYKLHSGEPLDVVGVSVPVWFHKGSTSEPAQEVFCKYRLTNAAPNRVIIPQEGGYSVNVPQLQKEAETDETPIPETANSVRLLDVTDGGAEGLEFRQYNKIHQDQKQFNVVHFVEIKPLELLEQTMS